MSLPASVSEETTTAPYVGPWYEEYDYADRMSTILAASFLNILKYHLKSGPDL